MPFSASIRLAQSSVSLSGITSARDLPCQVSRRSHIYRQSSGIDARPPDSHDFCPFYSAKIEFDELTIRYHFLGDSIKQLKAVVEKNRAEGEERSRLRQLERQKKAPPTARKSCQREEGSGL